MAQLRNAPAFQRTPQSNLGPINSSTERPIDLPNGDLLRETAHDRGPRSACLPQCRRSLVLVSIAPAADRPLVTRPQVAAADAVETTVGFLAPDEATYITQWCRRSAAAADVRQCHLKSVKRSVDAWI